MSKLIEKHIFNTIYLERSNILDPHQYGFIDQRFFIHKLNSVGINTSLLTNKVSRVRNDDYMSYAVQYLTRVLQGSCLGPPFSTISIKDVIKVLLEGFFLSILPCFLHGDNIKFFLAKAHPFFIA